jgi:HlyD family secretion protein
MTAQQREIFRPQSLERLATPDRLDQLLRVIGPQAWIAWLASAAVLAAGVAWAVIGRVPETVEGVGYLLHPRQIVAFQAPASGQIASFDLEIGAEVRPGDVLARLRLPELEKQLELERIRLDQTRALAESLQSMEAELAARERELIDSQKANLARRIASITEDGTALDQRTQEFLAGQRSNLATANEVSGDLLTELDSLSQKMGSLEKDQQASLLEGIDARARRAELELRVSELAVQGEELDLQEIVAEEASNRRKDSLEDLKLRLEQLEAEALSIQRRLEARRIEDTSRIQEIERNVEFYQTRLESEGELRSNWDGWIVEVTAAPGDRVDLGARLGKIKLREPPTPLQALCYFSVADGKRIQAADADRPGAAALVTPSTVERARHGGIRGRVESVSEFPVTTAAAAHQIGDVEVARALLGDQTRIEVVVELEREPGASGALTWTSGSRPSHVDISAGTTADVRVTIGERAPITYVLPFLRDLFGVEPTPGT